MSLALDYYINLNVSGHRSIPKWHKYAAACWNCGIEDCNVWICKKFKDKKKIAANCKEFLDERNHWIEDDPPNKCHGNHGEGGGGPLTNNNIYSHDKWGALKEGIPLI